MKEGQEEGEHRGRWGEGEEKAEGGGAGKWEDHTSHARTR